MTMWFKILRYELFRQVRNPLSIVCILLPLLTFSVSFATAESRIDMFEMVCGSRAAGVLTMFMRDNLMAWLVITTLLAAQNIRPRYRYFFNRTLPAGRIAIWGAEALSMWIITAMHWSVFFILLAIASKILVGKSLILPIMVVGTIFSCGGVMVMASSISRVIRNPILFTISFFCLFVLMSSIKGFQKYNIFAFTVITPNMISDFMIADTVRFLTLILPVYYIFFGSSAVLTRK